MIHRPGHFFLQVGGSRSTGPRDATPSGQTATPARHLQQQQAVPVILAVGPGSGAAALNATANAAIDAGLLNTTQCIRLAAAESGGAALEPPALAALNGTGGQPYVRPALDLRGCAVSVTPVATNSSNVVVQVSATLAICAALLLHSCSRAARADTTTRGFLPASAAIMTTSAAIIITSFLQVRVNARIDSLPAGALPATGGTVESLWPPFLDGAWEVHPAVVQLTAADAPCLLRVPADALAGAVEVGREAPTCTGVAAAWIHQCSVGALLELYANARCRCAWAAERGKQQLEGCLGHAGAPGAAGIWPGLSALNSGPSCAFTHSGAS